MKTFGLLVLLMILGLVGTVAVAESVPERGEFRGYYVVNRWGDKILSVGTRTLFLSDEAAKVLSEHKGKSLVVQTSKMVQPENGGAAMMMSVDEVTEVATPAVTISATIEKTKAAAGDGFVVVIRLVNGGKADVVVLERDVGLIFSTNKGVEPKGWKDPDGMAYWCSAGMLIGGEVRRWAYHEVKFPVGVIHTRANAMDDEVKWTVAAGGSYSVSVVVGKELAVGEYEIFAGISEVPSERVAVDVVAGK